MIVLWRANDSLNVPFSGFGEGGLLCMFVSLEKVDVKKWKS